MRRVSYAGVFALAVLALGTGGFMAFRRLEAETQAARAAAVEPAPAPKDTAVLAPFVPIAHDPDEYAKYEAEDAQWRQQNARQYTLAELRARGDGTRSPRELVEDKVYELTRRGQRARAISEMERWVARHPGDQQMLLALARLLNETGRNGEAVVRYRQLLAIKGGR